MNPDAPFAASRYVARPGAEVAAALLAMADRAWTMTIPAGRFALTRRLSGGESGCAGGPHLCTSGVLVGAADPAGLEVEVVVRACGERATELLLQPRWTKATPAEPARLEAGLLLANLAMDRLAADLAAELSTDPVRHAQAAEAPLVRG